jgi:hypothetical protein
LFVVFLYGFETWYSELREDHGLRDLEIRVLRRIFGRKGDELAGWRKPPNEELHNCVLRQM